MIKALGQQLEILNIRLHMQVHKCIHNIQMKAVSRIQTYFSRFWIRNLVIIKTFFNVENLIFFTLVLVSDLFLRIRIRLVRSLLIRIRMGKKFRIRADSDPNQQLGMESYLPVYFDANPELRSGFFTFRVSRE